MSVKFVNGMAGPTLSQFQTTHAQFQPVHIPHNMAYHVYPQHPQVMNISYAQLLQQQQQLQQFQQLQQLQQVQPSAQEQQDGQQQPQQTGDLDENVRNEGASPPPKYTYSNLQSLVNEEGSKKE